MSLPLIWLAISATTGTAHPGVPLGAEPDGLRHALTRVGADRPGHGALRTRARPVTGKGAAAHLPIPGHLMGYSGKPLDDRRSTARPVCTNCTSLRFALERIRQRAGQLLLPEVDPCHGDDTSLTLSGDAYTLSGCSQTHFVVAMTDRAGESHTDVLVFLPADECVTDVRIGRDRLVTIQRSRPMTVPKPTAS